MHFYSTKSPASTTMRSYGSLLRHLLLMSALLILFTHPFQVSAEEEAESNLQASTIDEAENPKTYLLNRHLLFRRTEVPEMRPLERRSLTNNEDEIIELDELNDFPGGRAKNFRMHNLFGRTIPIRSEKAPYAAKIFRIGGSQSPMFKARSFNDNGSYRDSMKRILLRIGN